MPPSSAAKRFNNDEIESLLDSKMNQQYEKLKILIVEENLKLSTKLDDFVKDFNNRLNKISEDVTALVARVESVENKHNQPPENKLINQLSDLHQQIDSLQREKICADAVLRGVPKKPNENLKEMFNTLCTSIKFFPAPVLKDIFRVKPKGAYEDTAIIIKFNAAADKNKLLFLVSQRFKMSKKALSLRDLNLDSDSPIHVNESLTSLNHMVLRKAFHLKRGKHLTAVYTRNGKVFIHTVKNPTKAYLINSCQDLVSITKSQHVELLPDTGGIHTD